MNPPLKTIIFIEPTCRGSRLQNLVTCIEAVKSHCRIILLTRLDYQHDHFFELTKAHRDSFEIIPIDIDLDGTWIRRLTSREFKKYLKKIIELDRQLKESYDLFFLAIDDYLPAFTFGFPCRFRLKHLQHIFALKYRVEFLIYLKGCFKNQLLKIMTHAALYAWKAQLLVLDDRLENFRIAGKRVQTLPDPWLGDFSSAYKREGREKFGFKPQDFVVLVIGRQTPRKGFNVVLASLDQLFSKLPNITVAIFGVIDEPYQSSLKKAVDKHGPERIRHTSSFVPEKDLAYLYAAASVVLLPYDRSFTATSGVLPRASASGIPVVASDHGAIGYLVKKWNVGELMKAGSVDDLLAGIHQIHSANDQNRAQQDGIHKFAQSCSEKAFIKRIRKILKVPKD